MKCQENLANYKAMIEHNFDKMLTDQNEASQVKEAKPNVLSPSCKTNSDQTGSLASKYNLQALQEKIKSFKFTKANAEKQIENFDGKDANWFSKLQKTHLKQENRSCSPKCKIGGLNKFEMSKEEHQKFNQELVQKYMEQKEELQPEYDRLKRVNRQLEDIRNEFGIQHLKQAAPQASTSFMQIKDAKMRKVYEQKVR